MCYPSPGPRCAAHTRKEFEVARLSYEYVINKGVPRNYLPFFGKRKTNIEYVPVGEPSISEVSSFMFTSATSTLGMDDAELAQSTMMEAAVEYYSTPEGLQKLRSQTIEDYGERLRELDNAWALQDNPTEAEVAEYKAASSTLLAQINELTPNADGEYSGTLGKLHRRRENQVTDFLVNKASHGERISEAGLIADINEEHNLDMVARSISSSEHLTPASLGALVGNKNLSSTAADHLATRGDVALALAAVKTGKTSKGAEGKTLVLFGHKEAAEIALSDATDNMKLKLISPRVITGAHYDKELQEKLGTWKHMREIKTAAGVELNYNLSLAEQKKSVSEYLAGDADFPEEEFMKLAKGSAKEQFVRDIAKNPKLSRAGRDAVLANPTLEHIALSRLAENPSITTEELDNIAAISKKGIWGFPEATWGALIVHPKTSYETFANATDNRLKKAREDKRPVPSRVLVRILARSPVQHVKEAALIQLAQNKDDYSQSLTRSTYASKPDYFTSSAAQKAVIDAYDYENRNRARINRPNFIRHSNLTDKLIASRASKPVMEYLQRTLDTNSFFDTRDHDSAKLRARIQEYIDKQ